MRCSNCIRLAERLEQGQIDYDELWSDNIVLKEEIEKLEQELAQWKRKI